MSNAAHAPGGRPVTTARTLAAALLAGLLLVHAAPAAGDADPASDVLLTQSVFYPYQPRVSPELETTLNSLLAALAREHMPLKVAIIGMQLELGAIPEYWGHPQGYAGFLDRELAVRPEPLLVVMPQGFGLVDAGPASALAHIPIDASERTYGLTRAAILAVVALADVRGHPTATPKLPPPPSAGAGVPTAVSVGLVVALVLALVLVMLRLRARRRLRRRGAARGAARRGSA